MANSIQLPSGPFQVEETGTGPTLICMHGLGGGAHWFRGLGERLADRFTVLAFDHPGTGANRVGDVPFSIERCAVVLLELIESRGAGPAYVLGHSMGTIIALYAYAMAPEKFRSMLFVGGLPAVTPNMHRRLSDRRGLIVQRGMAGLGWKATVGVFAKATIMDFPEMSALFARLWENYPSEVYVETLDALLAASAEDVPPRVHVPCLVLSGEEDAYAPPAESENFAKAFPPHLVKRVVMRDCGHMTFLEAPARFAKEISAYLNS